MLTLHAIALLMTPVHLDSNMSLMRVAELRTKARLALRTAAGITPVSGLDDRTVRDILSTSADDLIAASGAAPDAVLRLQEQAGLMQMTLDNRYLRQVTIGRLAQQG